MLIYLVKQLLLIEIHHTTLPPLTGGYLCFAGAHRMGVLTLLNSGKLCKRE